MENRVQEERRRVDHSLWSHFPGKENPADLPTCWSDPTQFATNIHWWNGPEWLKKDEEYWPNPLLAQDVPQTCLEEMKSVGKKVKQENSTIVTQVALEGSIKSAIPFENFISYQRLLHVSAYVLRFIENCHSKKMLRRVGELTAEEVNEAKILLFKQMQVGFSNKKLQVLSSHLGTYTDEKGLIRCYGCSLNSNLPSETIHAILLPRDHCITNLIIKDCHERVMHNGTKETVLQLRSHFWVIKGCQLVKKLIRKCVTCKKIQGQSYASPATGQLPEFRVREEHAFSSVGLDFVGPLYVKTSSNPLRKVYAAIFTCSTSRAIHLELVPDLSTETFLLCFINRRGISSLVGIDNAKTFKSKSKKIHSSKTLFKSAKIQAYLTEKRIKWKYNLAKAPWWGGFYERLIKSVKSCLKKCIGRANLSFDELHTTLFKIEGVLNLPPLTYLYSDELEEPLTPSHLILGRRILKLP